MKLTKQQKEYLIEHGASTSNLKVVRETDKVLTVQVEDGRLFSFVKGVTNEADKKVN